MDQALGAVCAFCTWQRHARLGGLSCVGENGSSPLFPIRVGAGDGYLPEAVDAESGGTRTMILDWGDTALKTWMMCGNAASGVGIVLDRIVRSLMTVGTADTHRLPHNTVVDLMECW